MGQIRWEGQGGLAPTFIVKFSVLQIIGVMGKVYSLYLSPHNSHLLILGHGPHIKGGRSRNFPHSVMNFTVDQDLAWREQGRAARDPSYKPLKWDIS